MVNLIDRSYLSIGYLVCTECSIVYSSPTEKAMFVYKQYKFY